MVKTKDMDRFAFLNNIDVETIDTLYNQYLNNPDSVDKSWRWFFDGYEFSKTKFSEMPNEVSNLGMDKEFNVINLIEGYRKRGHLFTKTNPVRTRRKYSPTLDKNNYNLSDDDLNSTFRASAKLGLQNGTLKEIIDFLENTYCQSIGCEYMFIREPEVIEWLTKKIEENRNTPTFTAENKKAIFNDLKKAVGFEQFIHRKFTGQKRFSLEGAESLIPALNAIVNFGADKGSKEFVIGMSHRGRLNVLANVLGKPYNNIFSEFLGEEYEETISLGDVKYHLGFSNKITTSNGKEVEIRLAPNPSHLETVAPVVQGISRSKIDTKYQGNYKSLIPIIVHGDAAISSQGVVYETLQMSQLNGYKTGGTIHIVVNNQIGFTTNYLDGRSSTYCTDIAKVTKAPIFHVNGDDAEAVVHTIDIAVQYRQKYHHDVFIDLLCYRKHGHNEGDEPRFTQPTLYKAISKHSNPFDIYTKKLIDEELFTVDNVKLLQEQYNNKLESELTIAQQDHKVFIPQFLKENWTDFSHPQPEDFFNETKTDISQNKFTELANKTFSLPEDKQFFKKVIKLNNDRLNLIAEGKTDWAIGELMAYASLIDEGFAVRVSGQDSERGTFSHRHAVLTIEDTTEKYTPLKNIKPNQPAFDIYNSPLSEYGVMGFEYGYALNNPKALTIWEAQFGDFHNVAQVIIDQYIASAEDKWGLMNGLVLMLPHGYEGQGPEHSSARIERFLTLCANYNIQVLNPSTPANIFHALRMQMHRNFRVPMVIFTPKSLLRHPLCLSDISDFTNNQFQRIIDDNDTIKDQVTRVVFCSGKLYYDLLEKKNSLGVKDIAIVRIEQIYPFPMDEFKAVLNSYPNAIKWIWAQEEPENMGAWNFIKTTLDKIELQPVTRLASGSPAVGLSKIHNIEQQNIINKIFRKCECHLNNVYCGLQCEKGSAKPEITRQYKYLDALTNPEKR